MVRFIKLILAGSLCFCLFSSPALGNNSVITTVKVIHASTGPKHVDPGLRSIISELESVFKYTSYKLLNEQNMTLHFNQPGQVTLPGNRTLIVLPAGMDGNRIQYQIKIMRKNEPIFQTRVLLKNNSSITIGGPQFKKGVLLFDISGSVQ